MLEVKSISFGYSPDKIIFRDLSFSVECGQVLAVLGLNGAGKTTLLKALSSQIELNGQINLMGQSLSEFNKVQRHNMAILEDTPFLYSYLSVAEYLQFVTSLKGMDYTKLRDKAEQGMAQFNLLKHRRTLCKMLSFGQKKKVYLLAQLVCSPKYVLMDEPTNGLDLQAILYLERMTKELLGEGAVVVYTSHNLSFLDEVPKKALVLNQLKQPMFFSNPTLSELRDLLLNVQGE